MQVQSQDLNVNYGANNLNTCQNKFVGIWKWENNGNNFTLNLKKQNISIPPYERNVKADILYGFHKYVKNNEIIENSLNNSTYDYESGKFTLSAGLGVRCSNNILEGSIYHISKNNKRVHFEIEYIDATHIKLVSLSNSPGTKVNISGQPEYDWSINLPQNIILTKQ